MPVLLCDLSSVVTEVSFSSVHAALAAANGGEVSLARPEDLRDVALEDFTTGRIGESELTRHLRARLGWRGSDPDLLAIMAGLYESVDIGVMELLVDLRGHGWHLVGILDGAAERGLEGAPDADDPMHRGRWGGQLAEQLTVFHQVHRLAEGTASPADPRHFAAALRTVPSGHGARLYVDSRPQLVAAARRAGLDAHLYRGAVEMRATCLRLAVGA